jgi:DNA-binding NarL/FixJ family response regulator
MGESVLIVDDHPGFRACARRLLESEGYRVVAEASDCASALAAAAEAEPELALVDVCLPDGSGFDLTLRLRALAPAPAVVLTSSRDDGEFGRCAAESGARGFVPKAELAREVIDQLVR